MAQSYFPIRQQTALMHPGTEKQLDAKNMQEAFVTHKNCLVHAIDQSKSILSDLRDFNKKDWIVRYPHFRDQSPSSSKGIRSSSSRRSMSFVDDFKNEMEVILKPRQLKGQSRSLSLAAIKDLAEDDEDTHCDEQSDCAEDKSDEKSSGLVSSKDDADFNVLRLDLNLGPRGSSSSASSLVSQLEKNSIATLLDGRIESSLKHIEKLRARVEDITSKVLVTGDLNAGKSTVVNAILRRQVMPVDQQPCTTAFCEVHDASENAGVEEVHIVKDTTTYNVKDESTFKRASIADLEELISENEDIKQMIKVYINDPRESAESFLNNGIVDISLIDAPGLNRDSVKTTALFARQEEIDVVVFVVSAENHFTLSAREFLESASREKAYVFIVVNKFEGIRDKNKCKRRVLEQVKELSPRTYEDAADLVHFVDSATVLGIGPSNPAFETLESSLRSFVLLKRSKSKLHPAATYLLNLLADVDLLSGSNAIFAKAELERAKEDLSRVRPVLEKLKNTRESLEESLEQLEEDGASHAHRKAKEMLIQALDRVGSGQLAIQQPIFSMPKYPGLLHIFDYTRDVRRALLASLDVAVRLAEDDARVTTSSGVKGIIAIGERFLPEGAEPYRRVFIPEAMFARQRTGKDGKTRRSGAVVAGGIYGLGIGLVQRQDLCEPTFFDIFDIYHHLDAYFGNGEKAKTTDEEEDALPSALGVVSVGLGALTMVGGKTLGARGLIEGIVRVTDLLENETARKWAMPVLGAFTLGLSVYLVLELPSTIPRTVGRRIRSTLTHVDAQSGLGEESTFVGAHSGRITRETRKVLRLASWDQKERFRHAMEERAKQVEGAERVEKQSENAVAWFTQVQQRTSKVREEVEPVVDL